MALHAGGEWFQGVLEVPVVVFGGGAHRNGTAEGRRELVLSESVGGRELIRIKLWYRCAGEVA